MDHAAPAPIGLSTSSKSSSGGFGRSSVRDIGRNRPCVFDPDASEPVPMSSVKMEADVLETMRKAGTPSEIAYAYKKTGLLYVEGVSENWPRDRVKEWKEAIDESSAVQATAAAPEDRPDPEEWSTEIPELLASGFDRNDWAKVREILRAITPIEEREPVKVITRIELAAAFLASACGAAYDSAAETGAGGHGPSLYAVTEELVLRRARQKYTGMSRSMLK